MFSIVFHSKFKISAGNKCAKTEKNHLISCYQPSYTHFKIVLGKYAPKFSYLNEFFTDYLTQSG